MALGVPSGENVGAAAAGRGSEEREMQASRGATARRPPDRMPTEPAPADVARFLAEATHELRGGAARLALMAEALADQARPAPAPDPRLSPRLAALAAEGRRVQALASALLDVAQLAREGRHLEIGPVSVAEVLDAVLTGEMARADQHVEVHVPPELVVVADPLALDQILSNLVRNAFQHGGRRVTVEGWAEPGDRVAVAVADDGPGIAPERTGELFSPYPRDDGRGTGLGLTIAAQLARLMGGSLSHEGDALAGPRFVVRLPAS
jgi:signal transduction histidine kinase